MCLVRQLPGYIIPKQIELAARLAVKDLQFDSFECFEPPLCFTALQMLGTAIES